MALDKQIQFVHADQADPGQLIARVAAFDIDGNPVDPAAGASPADGSITTAMLADGAVTHEKLATAAVRGPNIGPMEVAPAHLKGYDADASDVIRRRLPRLAAGVSGHAQTRMLPDGATSPAQRGHARRHPVDADRRRVHRIALLQQSGGRPHWDKQMQCAYWHRRRLNVIPALHWNAPGSWDSFRRTAETFTRGNQHAWRHERPRGPPHVKSRHGRGARQARTAHP
ncbi:hypothetical protein [Bifidobacterium leontopitheci]